MSTGHIQLAASLRKGSHLGTVVAGFDGFVDELISVVAERRNLNEFTPVPGLSTFGKLINDAAGHSSLREIVVNDVQPGGCAVNLADGLATLGVPVDVFATLGSPMHPAFAEPAAKFRSCHSWGEQPGRTLAFEFKDGKVMFSAVSHLAGFTPGHVAKMLEAGQYASACVQARVIALTDWSLYPHMTEVWRLLQKEVFAKLAHRPGFFIDLVDPGSRSAVDILAMLNTLHDFEGAGPLTLGLNSNEANAVAQVLGIERKDNSAKSMLERAAKLQKRLAITEVVVHQPRFAVVTNDEAQVFVNGPFCENPQKSTGAGDRFNAGFILGKLLRLDAASQLRLGSACAGFFVRNSRSPRLGELGDFLEWWETQESNTSHTA